MPSIFRNFRTHFIGVLLFCGCVSNAQNLDSIRTILDTYYQESLSLRQQVMPTISKFGYESKQMDSLNSAILYVDSLGLVSAVTIIERYGWLGKSEVGEMGNSTLFLIIQHAPENSLREKYYPLLEESVRKGESKSQDMATMKDRILIGNGLKQWYGTQTNHKGEYLPIEDPKNVNKRRREVGLKKIKLE